MLLLLLLGQSGGFTARCWSGRRRRWHCALIAQVPQAAPVPALPTNLADEESFVALAAPPTQPSPSLPLYLLLLLLLPSLSADLCERGASVKLTNLSAREAQDDAAPGSPTKNSAANHLATVPLTIPAPLPFPFRSPSLHLGAKVKTFRKSGAERSAN